MDGSSLGAAPRDSFNDNMKSLGQSLNDITDRRKGAAHKPEAATTQAATLCMKPVHQGCNPVISGCNPVQSDVSGLKLYVYRRRRQVPFFWSRPWAREGRRPRR